MKKVMLVDDDKPVLDYLRAAIPWTSLGLELHATCKNGRIALECARAEMPDIVVTDIGMPQMDGMELIEALKALKPELRVVILSCMDDFGHAQRAVKLKVYDYVLKESMRAAELTELLRRLRCELVQEEEAAAQIAAWKTGSELGMLQRRQQLLRRLVHEPLSDAECEQSLEAAGVDCTDRQLAPVLVCGSAAQPEARQPQSAQADGVTDAPHAAYALERAAAALARLLPEALLLPYSAREMVALLPVAAMPGQAVRTELLGAIAQLRQAVHEAGAPLMPTFVYARPTGVNLVLGRAMQRLLLARELRFYVSPGGTVEEAEAEMYTQEDLFVHYPEASRQIRTAFMEEDEPELLRLLEGWFERIGRGRYPPQLVKEWTLKMLYDNQVRLLALEQYPASYSIEALHQTVAQLDTLGELREWTAQFFRDRLPIVQRIHSQSRRSEILRAKQHVERHLDKKMTLEEVAALLHINASYFSRLFKKETGYNFIHYVTLTKMERGKELLEQTPLSVDEVAERLGYDNKSYFTKLFKKHTGRTPGEYRG
ncbi:AraC family transcriptional regulator [Paenibacillus sp. IB182496]|uniref:AraC family transcriptional regulator n=1 Tax=Paenibacillus sabuli TaxID=2772509 RepID=A0A927BRK2_9BACL|nr:helix-turn-helix domain-containing protein [Paenibacillus sabuli]MBD2844249.1 AraC family transcriptional regulator [Paenibacillus sabuli]